jgi:xylulokinase
MMYLGLDLGTSGIKALLINEQQRVIGSAVAPLSVERPNPGWSEQDPAIWLAGCEAAIDQLKRDFPGQLSSVRGIGLSGQMHGATMLDETGTPVYPAILWNDTRSFREAADLDANPAFRRISGNIVFPGFTAPKLLWMRSHEPECFARIRKILLPKDYLRYWLTGEYVSDMSDAAGTSWLDVEKRQWSQILLVESGVSPDHMPALVEGSAPSGTLRSGLAARWGLKPGVVVAGGAGDNAASAIGLGITTPGSAFVSLGTSGVLFVANECYRPNPQSAVHAFCHALPNKWHQMGVILSATDSLNWLARLVGKDPALLTKDLGEQLAAPGSLTFLPYLSGERTPHNDASIRGAFTGISHNTNAADMTRAVLEGVAFALKDCLSAMASAGTMIDSVMAVGGGSRSDYWLKLIATILEVEVRLPSDGDFGAAFGAARLAILASENIAIEAVCKPPVTAKRFEPNQRLVSQYTASYQKYRATYPAIRSISAR